MYFLLYGSVLGAVRHKGFIPWDDDIDIGLYRKDFEKLEKILKETLPKDFYYYKVGEIQESPIGRVVNKNKKNYPTIDIFPIDNVPSNKFLQKIQKIFANLYHLCVYRKPAKNRGKKIYYLTKTLIIFIPNILFDILEKISKKVITYWQYEKTEYIGNILAGEENKDVRLYTDFGKGVKKIFEGKEFIVPEKYDKYLTQLYGNYMILPNEEKRQPSHRNFNEV